MKLDKPNIVYIAFSMLATIVLTFLGVYSGINLLIVTYPVYGRATMFFIISAMIVMGGVALLIAEIKKRKDIEMLGMLLNVLGVVILLFLNAASTGVGVLAGIVLFAFAIFDILGLYIDKKIFKILPFVFASISLLLLLVTGIVGFTTYASSYDFIYVLSFFGYFFIGIAVFVLSLPRLIAERNPEPVVSHRLSEEKVEELKALKAKHDAKKISDEEFEKKRSEIVG